MDNQNEILQRITAMEKLLLTMAIVVRGDRDCPESTGMVGDIASIKRDLKPLVNTINRNQNDISRIWWWLGGISLAILATAVSIIRG